MTPDEFAALSGDSRFIGGCIAMSDDLAIVFVDQGETPIAYIGGRAAIVLTNDLIISLICFY